MANQSAPTDARLALLASSTPDAEHMAAIAGLAVIMVTRRATYAELFTVSPQSITEQIEHRQKLAAAEKALDESMNRLVHAVRAYLTR